MEAKELRMGNWVLYDETIYAHGKTKEPFIVDAEFISNLDEADSDYSDMILGIPITEEWLLKFGFKMFKDKAYLFQNWTIDLRGNVWIINNKISTIKHVHELQNLYYALTGKELEIKE